MPDNTAIYTIEYHGPSDVMHAENFTGTVARAENLALLGLIRHLYAGVQEARIVSEDGVVLNSIQVPAR